MAEFSYDDEIVEIEYFTDPHCDHCDSSFVEGIGVVPVKDEWWCLPCADIMEIEYKEWDA